MSDDLTRISTSCYAAKLADAKLKLGLDPNDTLDKVLDRVIHGDADQQLSLEAWLKLGKTFIHNDRA